MCGMLWFVGFVLRCCVGARQRLALVLVLVRVRVLVQVLVLNWLDLFSSKIQIWDGLHELSLGFLQKSVNVLSAVLG